MLGRDLQVKCHYRGQHREGTKLTAGITLFFIEALAHTNKELLNFFKSSTDHYMLKKRKVKQNKTDSRCDFFKKSKTEM